MIKTGGLARIRCGRYGRRNQTRGSGELSQIMLGGEGEILKRKRKKILWRTKDEMEGYSLKAWREKGGRSVKKRVKRRGARKLHYRF